MVSAALTFAFLVPFALIVLVLLVVVVLVDRHDDLDPEGRRPFAAYVFVVVFLTLFTTLFAVAAMVSSLVHLAVDDDGSSQSDRVSSSTQTFTANGSTITTGSGSSSPGGEIALSSHDSDDAHIRDAVRAGLLAATAGAVLVFHLGMARRVADDSDSGGPRAGRIYHAYLYAAMALAVIIAVAAATALGYAVFKGIAPGVASPSGVGKRKNALPDLATSIVLLAGAGLIFLYHFRRRPADGAGAAPALPPAPDGFAPPPEPEPEPEREPAPPRRSASKAPASRKSAPRRGARRE